MRLQPFKIVSRTILITTLVMGTADGAIPVSPAREAELAALLATAQPVAATAAAAGNASAPAESARVHWSADGFVRYLGAPPAHHFPATGAGADQPEVAARQFLQQHASLLGVQTPALDFQPVKQKTHRGRHYLRFQQHYAGLPVFAAQATVQLDSQSGVEAVFSDLERDTQALAALAPSLAPKITAEQAVLAAQAILNPAAPPSAFSNTAPALVIFSPSVVGQVGEVRLAWDFRLASDWGERQAEQMLVDAYDGRVLFRNPLIHSALNRLISDHFTLATNESGQAFYPWVRSEGEAPSTNAQVNLAYDGIGDAYQFYFLEHGRTNWVGPYESGQRARVRYCTANDCPWAGAVYEGSTYSPEMRIGLGFATDDVVAHEYTHGVTESESSLIYRNASGAINESFSDIWGEFVDLTNTRGNDNAAVRWDIGEDLPNGRIRSMKNPPALGHPDRLGSPLYIPPPSQPTQGNDYGGVHSNSGVGNKLCYLLTDGGTFNGSTVTGLGIFLVAELFYDANANLLQPASDWTDLFNALRQAAINLGWTSPQRANVYRACRAVEIAPPTDLYVDQNSTCPIPAGLPLCVLNLGPYLSVRQGVTNALAGDTLHLQSGNYNETLTLSSRLTLKPLNGPTTIGKP